MPAYSFKEMFVPMVVDGSKKQTVRARRKRPAKEMDTLYLFFGLRTKWVRRLRTEICSLTHSLSITERGIVIYSRLLDFDELERAASGKAIGLPFSEILTDHDANQFAWLDGFRPEGSSLDNPDGAFELMLSFWKETHQLPWAGDIIYWEPDSKKQPTT